MVEVPRGQQTIRDDDTRRGAQMVVRLAVLTGRCDGRAEPVANVNGRLPVAGHRAIVLPYQLANRAYKQLRLLRPAIAANPWAHNR